MKRALQTAVLLLLTNSLVAQEEPKTILGSSKHTTSTFYWGPSLKWHFYNNRMTQAASPLLGGQLGVIINRKVIIGVGGWGKIARTSFTGHYIGRDDGQVIDNPHQRMAVGYGYGGLVLGMQFASNKSMHVTFTSLFGLGSSNEYIIEDDGDHGTTFNSPGFGIVEPTVNLELNLTRNLRLEIGAGYRWIGANRFEQLRSSELSGLTLNTALKIGRY